jgi:hypothetical protein
VISRTGQDRTRVQTPPTVFFDPAGRRRRAWRTALLVIVLVVAGLTALVVIGLTVRAQAPRTLVGHSASAWPLTLRTASIAHG